jgi:hypothetical protein
VNPFEPPAAGGDAGRPSQKKSKFLESLRVQAGLCFSAAAFAAVIGRWDYPMLRGSVIVLGAACGVQCLWRESKRRERAAGRRFGS